MLGDVALSLREVNENINYIVNYDYNVLGNNKYILHSLHTNT